MPDSRPSLRVRTARTWSRLRTRGLAEIFDLVRARAVEWVGSEDELTMLSRPATGPPPAFRHDPHLSLRRATEADATEYARAIGTDSPATFRGRLTATSHCFLVHLQGELLHSSWVTTSAAWTREVRAFVRPPPGDAYVYESFTTPEARGRGVYPFALAGICGWGTEQGLRNVWVAVERGNEPSLRAITKAGFRPVYSIRYSRRLGRLSVDATPAPDPHPLLSNS